MLQNFHLPPLRWTVSLFCLALHCSLSGQPKADSLSLVPLPEQLYQHQLEQLVEEGQLEEEGEFILQNLSLPISLNEASEEELSQLGILTPLQITHFLNYRASAGQLIAIYELQVIPYFDMATIKALLPFVSLDRQIDDFHQPFSQMLRKGKKALYLRWSRFLEPQKGYSGNGSSSYLGDPDYFSFRFRHQHSNRLSYGLVGEKDRGEPFFKHSNRYGFDFYSVHFFLRNYSSQLKALAIGDFKASFGQGLLLYQGYSGGKSALATSLKKANRPLAPHQSTGEGQFFRGLGATVVFAQNWQATAFLAFQPQDAHTETDELDGATIIRTLYNDGLHRTVAEQRRKRASRLFTMGQQLQWHKSTLQLSLNTLWTRFGHSVRPEWKPYRQFQFKGQHQFHTSVDYSFLYKNAHFFGEFAVAQNGAVASLHSILLGLGPKMELAIAHRWYAKNYQAFFANAFGAGSNVSNENGIYLGLSLRPAKNWKLSVYTDLWRHPWLRYQVDAPSTGRDYRIRITHFKKRRYEVYLEGRDQTRMTNSPDSVLHSNHLLEQRSVQLRFHYNQNLNKALELRTRIDRGFTRLQGSMPQQGFSAFQDVLFRPLQFPLSFTFRFAIFDTQSYDQRFYNYENNLLNSFSIPAYYNRGSRWYLNLRYKANRNWTIEGRIAQTRWENQLSIGSGLEETVGPVKTEISFQIRYQVAQKK